jgi:hypothetical protein
MPSCELVLDNGEDGGTHGIGEAFWVIATVPRSAELVPMIWGLADDGIKEGVEGGNNEGGRELIVLSAIWRKLKECVRKNWSHTRHNSFQPKYLCPGARAVARPYRRTTRFCDT